MPSRIITQRVPLHPHQSIGDHFGGSATTSRAAGEDTPMLLSLLGAKSKLRRHASLNLHSEHAFLFPHALSYVVLATQTVVYGPACMHRRRRFGAPIHASACASSMDALPSRIRWHIPVRACMHDPKRAYGTQPFTYSSMQGFK